MTDQTSDSVVLHGRTLVTGTRASAFWGPDPDSDNRRFLAALDPGYFRFMGETLAERFGDGDNQRPALALRTIHGQALKTLFALLAAASQSHAFPLGWMLRYRNPELDEVVEAIQKGRPILNSLGLEQVTWRGCQPRF